jgi:hypothetical protein
MRYPKGKQLHKNCHPSGHQLDFFPLQQVVFPNRCLAPIELFSFLWVVLSNRCLVPTELFSALIGGFFELRSETYLKGPVGLLDAFALRSSTDRAFILLMGGISQSVPGTNWDFFLLVGGAIQSVPGTNCVMGGFS